MTIRDVNIYKALILGVVLNFYGGTIFAMFLPQQQRVSRKQSEFIKVHNDVKKENGDIPVPLKVAQKSVVISDMLTDLGDVNEVISSDISIPLNASLKTIRTVLCSILIFPLPLSEEIEKQSLKNIIKQFNFLHSYDFPEYTTQLHEKKLKNYTIIDGNDAEIIEGVNSDIKKRLFIDPAIEGLRKIIIDQHLNDKDRKTNLLPIEEDSYCFVTNENGEIVKIPSCEMSKSIYSFAFRPDGKGMVSGGGTALGAKLPTNLLFWTMRDDGAINPVPQLFSSEFQLPEIYSVAFSGDGKYLAVGAWGNPEDRAFRNLMIWKFKEDGTIDMTPQIVRGHVGAVDAVAFHPKHKKMVSGGEKEHDIFLWSFDGDGTINTTPQKLAGHSDGVRRIVFAPDGKIMVSLSSGDKDNLLLWNYDGDGNVNAVPQKLAGSYPCAFGAIALNSDGKKLVSGNGLGVTLWDLSNLSAVTYKDIYYFPAASSCASLAFSNDGKIIMQGGSGHIRQSFLCDVNNPAKGQQINFPSSGYSSLFSPNGKNIIASFYAWGLISLSLFKPEEEKLFTQLSQDLSAAGGQLITRLCSLLEKKEKTKLSDFYQNIYNRLPSAVQKLCEGAVLKDA